MERIVVLGAGYAGVLTAKKLEKKFKKNTDISTWIIHKIFNKSTKLCILKHYTGVAFYTY